MLNFSDGVSIDTSGKLRILELHDGWYVVGQGQLIPVDSKRDAQNTLRRMKRFFSDKSVEDDSFNRFNKDSK
jgi:hypothetical protein